MQIWKSVNIFVFVWKYVEDFTITKPCTHLHPRPSASTQCHPPLTSSFQPPLSSIHLHPAHCSLTQLSVISSSLLKPNSPNLGWKFQSCSFWLKIGTHNILEVPIPNPDLDFWNSDPKIHFWANLGQKSQSFLFCLETGMHGISRMLILIPTLVF